MKYTIEAKHVVFRDEETNEFLGGLSMGTFRTLVEHTRKLAKATSARVSTSIWLNEIWEFTIAYNPKPKYSWTTIDDGMVVSLVKHLPLPRVRHWHFGIMWGRANKSGEQQIPVTKP